MMNNSSENNTSNNYLYSASSHLIRDLMVGKNSNESGDSYHIFFAKNEDVVNQKNENSISIVRNIMVFFSQKSEKEK